MFDLQKLIMLKIKASNKAIGVVISQLKDNKQLHPIAYYSKKLSTFELNYKIHNKKLLAIVDAIKHWQMYLKKLKHQVQVCSDHKNFIYFTTTKKLNQQQMR